MENESTVRVNGTLIWYYYICKREVWLMARDLTPDQDNEYIDIGRFIHQDSYSRDRKEVSLGNIKFDILRKGEGQIIIGEVKKSSKFITSAKMQLAFYLYELRNIGIEARGELMFPKEKKRVEVILSDEVMEELKRTRNDILSIAFEERPPAPKKIHFCRNCGYAEFCWS